MENIFLRNYFEKEIIGKLFSAYQYGTVDSHSIKKFSSGTFSFENTEQITDETLFDLASLTKVLLTVPLYYDLFAKKVISEKDPVSKFLSDFDESIQIIDLLKHTSGLPAWLPFFQLIPDSLTTDNKKSQAVDIINRCDIGERTHLYSDLNYILLGFILEKIYQQDLCSIFKNFKTANDLNEIITFSPETKTPLTAFSNLRNGFPDRTVEDENCYFLGGSTGHAGLFASAESTLKYTGKLLKKEWFIETGKRLSFAGFDRPEGTDSNYGKKADASFIGHLGFTGTALLINPKTAKASVLFTNSTHPTPDKPDRKERIKKCRQLFFDSV